MIVNKDHLVDRRRKAGPHIKKGHFGRNARYGYPSVDQNWFLSSVGDGAEGKGILIGRGSGSEIWFGEVYMSSPTRKSLFESHAMFREVLGYVPVKEWKAADCRIFIEHLVASRSVIN